MQKEFSLRSKGIGKNYVTDQIVKWHKADKDRNYVQSPRGFKVPMPKYYRNLIYDKKERDRLIGHVKKRVEETREETEKKHVRNGLNPEKMRISEITAKQKKLQFLREKDRDIEN